MKHVNNYFLVFKGLENRPGKLKEALLSTIEESCISK